MSISIGYGVSQNVPINLKDIKEEEMLETTKRSKKESSYCCQHITHKNIGVENEIDIWKHVLIIVAKNLIGSLV